MPDGHWYQVSLDWVETALFYNVAMFEEAGVEADWANWGEFLADMKTLQDTLGVAAIGSFMPGTGWNTWYWADSLWLSAVWADKASEIYMDNYSDRYPDVDWRQLQAEEYAHAIHTGVLNAHDPRMDHYLRISKDSADRLHGHHQPARCHAPLARRADCCLLGRDLEQQGNYEFGLL